MILNDEQGENFGPYSAKSKDSPDTTLIKKTHNCYSPQSSSVDVMYLSEVGHYGKSLKAYPQRRLLDPGPVCYLFS